MDKVRVGVIGIGWFGEIHVDTFMGIPNAEVVAICTRTVERLNSVAKKYGIKKTYTNYNDLLNDDEIDAVTICTHAADHLPPMLAALKSGKHVLLEKPAALTVEECDQMVEAAKDCKQNIMVGHICRFENNYAIAKKEVENGRIGDVLSIYARRNIGGDRALPHLNILSSISGDSVHDIDLMNWIVNAKAKSVYAMASNARNLPNADVGWVSIKYGNGALAVSESIWNLPPSTPYDIDARMEIVGTEGVIYINESTQPLIIDDKTGRKSPDTVYWPVVHGKRVGALNAELSYFVDCIIKGEKPKIITLEESREVVRVIEAAEKSAKTGQVITL
jgi:UDP-N-acetylglucosamine 3-dehydrogenase